MNGLVPLFFPGYVRLSTGDENNKADFVSLESLIFDIGSHIAFYKMLLSNQVSRQQLVRYYFVIFCSSFQILVCPSLQKLV